MESKKTSTRDIFKELIKVLNKLRINYMIVGGIAANYYRNPRPTFDFDILLESKPKDINNFISILREAKLKINEEEIRKTINLSNVIIAEFKQSPYRIDIWFATSEFDKVALKRRRKRKLFGKKVYLISPEDLIIEKLKDNRPQDIEDIISILLIKKYRLNMEYIKKWVKVLRLEKRFDKINKEVENIKCTHQMNYL